MCPHLGTCRGGRGSRLDFRFCCCCVCCGCCGCCVSALVGGDSFSLSGSAARIVGGVVVEVEEAVVGVVVSPL